MNLRAGETKEYSRFSRFKSVKEFDIHMELWLMEHPFTKGELLGLKQLIRFATKYPGVCNAKIATIVKATHLHKQGISRSTFKRMVSKAQAINLITIFQTVRGNGSQTSNLYVFNPFPSEHNEPAKSPILDHLCKTKTLLKKPIKDLNKRTETLDASYTSEVVPNSFTLTVQGFFNDAAVIEGYWRMAKIAAYRNNRETEVEIITHTAILAFKQMIGKWKRDRLKNPIAYFYAIMMRKLEELYFEELFEMGFEPVDMDYPVHV